MSSEVLHLARDKQLAEHLLKDGSLTGHEEEATGK
jgi:hypothetical protein